ncbi:MAG TPA: cupredoxin domain-containing protein [Sporichthya sp.]|nr:cupredoxin domain-containing protein [Sporichthya sp.]
MTQRAIAYRIAAAAAALTLLAACGGGDEKATAGASQGDKPLSTPVATPAAGSSAQPAGKKAAIQVDESEYMIMMDKTYTAGTYTFTVSNQGKFPHALQIDGPGVKDQGTGNIAPGNEGSVTVTLQKGTYHFYCPVSDHESKGMALDVTVT